jgi:hypothetical protein
MPKVKYDEQGNKEAKAPAPAAAQADPAAAQADPAEATALPAAAEPRVPAPDDASDDLLAEHAGLGNEEVRIDDAATPFIRILQANSPECKRSDAKYIPGAQEGMFYHTLHKLVLPADPPLLLVNCFFEPLLIEWTPREKGGGMARVYDGNDPIIKKVTQVKDQEGRTRNVLPNGNHLVETAQHYNLWLNRDQNRWEHVVLGLSSSQLKHSRALNALLLNEKVFDRRSGALVPAPRFSRFVTATTKVETKDKNSWFGYDFNLGPRITAPVVPDAIAFAKLLQSGKRRTRPTEEDVLASSGVQPNGAEPRPGGLSDDMPL